jgi:hypothetical protein
LYLKRKHIHSQIFTKKGTYMWKNVISVHQYTLSVWMAVPTSIAFME